MFFLDFLTRCEILFNTKQFRSSNYIKMFGQSVVTVLWCCLQIYLNVIFCWKCIFFLLRRGFKVMELPHLTFIGIKCLAVSGTFIRSQKAIRNIALVPAVFQVLPKTVQLARRRGQFRILYNPHFIREKSNCEILILGKLNELIN